jgi:hypothetical protein
LPDTEVLLADGRARAAHLGMVHEQLRKRIQTSSSERRADSCTKSAV